MSVTELEKGSLLSEIEENLSNTISFKYKSVQEDVMQLYADRDNLISQDAIQVAISHGVDPRQMVTLPEMRDKSFFRSMDSTTGEDLKLDNQFEFFVSTFETLELVDLIYHTSEEDSAEHFVTAKDRLLNLKLPRVSFNPLFDSIKDSNSVLFRTLAQLPIISGQGKSRKKAPAKKEKKHKDRSKSDHSGFLLDRTSGGAFGKLKNAKNKKDGKGDSATSGTPLGFEHTLTWSEDTLLEPKKYKEVLALIVAKNIADNTLSSYLATVALLLSVSRDDRYSSELSLGSQHSLLPVGSTIAALFDSGSEEVDRYDHGDDDLEEVSDDNEEEDEEEEEHDDDMDEEGDSRLMGSSLRPHGGSSATSAAHPENMSLNPFRNYVIANRRRSKSMTNSDVSRYDESLLSLDRDRSSSKDEINSSYGVYHHNPHRSVSTASGGPYSDAGSTIGSTIGSTLAEIGTETASMQGDDLSEEELLAQALALSMGAEHLLMTSSTPTQQLHAESGSATAAADTSLASYDVRSSDHNLDMGGMQSIEASMTGLNVVFDRQAPHSVPEDLPAVDPLSTFGPFSCSQFWSRVVTPSTTKHHSASSTASAASGAPAASSSGVFPNEENNTIMGNLVTLRHVIMSLLVVVSHSADQVLGINQADEKDSETHSKTKFAKASGKKSTGKATDPSADSVGSSELPHYIRGVATNLTVAPNPILIHLIEHLMDVLIQELIRHCSTVNQSAKGSSKATGDRLSFSSADGRMQLDDEDFHRAASPSGSDGDGYEAVMRRKEQLVRDRLMQEENQDSEWHFHQYFLVFSINVLMKLFRATMQVVVSNGMSVLAIGLGAIDRYDAPSDEGASGADRPLLQRLLKHFSDCMGGESALIRNGLATSPLPDGSSLQASVGALHEALTNAIKQDRKTVDVFTTVSNTILVAPSSAESTAKQVALCFSSINFRHQLRLIAANSFVATLSAYHNTVYKRYVFVERLLRTVPNLSDSLVGHYFEDSSLLQLLNIEHYERNFDAFLHNTSAEFSKEPPLSFYQLYLLQKVTNATLTLDDHAAGLVVSPSYPKINKLVRKSTTTGSSGSGTSSSSAASSSSKEKLSLDSVLKKSDSELKEEAQLSTVLQSILNLLMSRLKDPYLVHGVQKHRHYAPNKGLFSGELNLLRALQFRVMANYSTSIYDRTHLNQSSFDFFFSAKRSHPNMNVTEDSRVVIHNGPKVWATASSSLALEPNSGIYEWHVKVDRCAKGHAFIGIVTADCPVERDNYVGVDRHSYGCIGTKSLWHNKSKVVTEYGQGFASGSLISCRLDTNKGTLSYSSVDSGTDWGVAFENIPKVAIYPAVSLHERDDQMTLVRCVKVTSSGTTSNAPPSLSLPMSSSTGSIDVLSEAVCTLSESDFLAERDMIQYMTQLHGAVSSMLNMVEKILASGSSGAVEDVEVILSHPMIGVLLPSVMACFASSSYEMNNILHMSVVHLLPLFLTLTKRLSGAYDALSGFKKQSSASGSVEKMSSDFVHSFTGSWMLKSSAISFANISAQEYILNFSDTVGESKSPKLVQTSSSCTSVHTPVTKLFASGSSANSTVKCHGTQFGTRVKFMEVWSSRESVSNCLVEGRISLCGLYFSGRYKDVKTNKMGSITGTRVGGSAELTKNDDFFVRSTVYRTVLLGMMAVSKFSCHLMVSNISKTPSFLSKAAQTSGFSQDVSPMTMEVDPGDMSPVPGSANLGEEVADVDMSAADHALSTQCVNSDLFSGGFSLRNAHLTEYLVKHVVAHIRPTVLSASSSIDIPASQELLWWIINAVPDLKSHVLARLSNTAVSGLDAGSASAMLTIDQLAERDFYADMISEESSLSSMCNVLDATISRHTGQSALIRIGGEVVQKARKFVLAAVIKHTGTYTLCVHEHRVIKEKAAVQDLNNDLEGKYRPTTVLLDVWQAVQRIMERAVRAKLENSSTYASVCDVLCHKAKFLLEVEVGRQALVNAESIAMVLTDQTFNAPKTPTLNASGEPQAVKDFWSTPDSPGHNVAQDVSKCITSIVEFLTNSMRNTSAMRELMYHRAFSAVLRSAGMKSLLVLLNKASSDGLPGGVQLPAITHLTLQCCPFTDLLQALRDINAAVNNRSAVEMASNTSSSAHYLDGLWGVSESLLNTCRSSMEAMYDLMTKYLSRSSWAGSCFRDGQIVALSSWLVAVKPEDHSFLSKIAIFRVLQGVLEDARTSIANMYEKYPYDTFFSRSGDSYELDLLNRFKDHPEGVFACDALLNSHKKLATLVLTVVHGLAVQVASVKEGAKAIVSGPSRLQRNQSGPDTLSKSLFDLMYIELFSTVRGLLIAANNTRTSGTKAESPKQASSSSMATSRLSLSMLGRRIDSPTVGVSSSSGGGASEASSEECLEGELYAYRILRLLFLVSSSKLCQKLLVSPKWISLFVSCIGFGGISIQRRVMTLLRRLLMNSEPSSIVGYVPSLFDFRDDIVSAETPLDDDDFKLLMDDSSGKSTPQKLIQFFFEGVSAIYPHTSVSAGDLSPNAVKDQMRASFIALSYERNMLDALSADSLVILRVLYGIPSWRRVISAEIVANMSENIQIIADAQADEGTSLEYSNDVYLSRIQQLYRLSSALSVVGGYTERLRMGGQVTLKPFCLLGSSADVYATKIAAATYSSAMLISTSTSTASVEVVLMEKGIKITCTDAKSDPSDSKGDLKVMIQHTTLLASSIPVKTIRLNSTDVLPSPDIAVISSLIQSDIVSQLIDAVSLLTVPWLKAALSPPAPASTNNSASKSFVNVMKVISNVFSVKSLSIALQNEMSVEMFLEYKTNVFKDLLLLAIMPTQYGHLNVLECLEDRFSKLWVAFCKPEAKPEPKHESEPTPSKSGSATKSLIRDTISARERLVDRQRELERERESRMEAAHGGAAARDLAGILSSYGAARAAQIDPATKAAALAQMLEIGLQQDFCEFALRRCHYDVEMAINMCLEHGSDMSMLIAEEAMFNAANATREASAAAVGSTARRSHFLSREPSIASGGFSSGIPALDSRIHLLEQRIAAAAGVAEGSSHADGSAPPPVYMRIGRSTTEGSGSSTSSAQARGYRPSAREVGDSERESEGSLLSSRMLLPPLGRTSSSSGASDPQSLIRQLLAMGFPPSWCARAIASNNGDLEGALGYILTHDAELSASTNETMSDIRSSRLGRLLRSRRDEPPQQSSAMDMDPEEEFFNDADLMYPMGDDADNAVASEDDADSEPAFRPVVNVSGQSDIKSDMSCFVTSGGFPSVGCRYYPVSTGKWYYELTVLTSGCIQVGWVDSAYEGAADAGQGVGDDIHSWAYDGWRTYLWHETSAEWGTKWSSGDVVGCAVDCDNRTMAFYLNGFGVEISMGEAFKDIEFHGGVYPCVSFNRNEKIKFCFGGSATPFKHTPPPGYRAFNEHILEQRERNRELMKILNPGVRSQSGSTAGSAAVAAGLLHISPSTEFDYMMSASSGNNTSSGDELEIEDSFESGMGEKAFPWYRRYFAADDASSSNTTHALTSETFNYFSNTAGYLPRLPTEKADIVTQMESVGRDLCILYCRLSILRTLNKLSSVSESGDSTRKNQLIGKILNTQHVTADDDNEKQVVVESILTLIRIASAHTNRTKAYISAMSMFSTSFSTPSNFGSIYCTGGYPLLLQLRDTFTALVSHGRSATVANIVDAMIGEVFNTTRGAIRRDYASTWKLESNFAPIGGSSSDSVVTNSPSLSLAVWMTSILMELFIKELGLETGEASTSRVAVDHSIISSWISKLMRVWMFALRSPAVTVKICAMRIITYILQEFMTSHESRTVVMLNNIVAELFTQNNSLQRYEEHTIYKLNAERINLPVCSEYVQALLEFTTSIKNIFHLHVLQNTVSEQQQLENDSCLMRMDSGDLSPSVAMMDVASVPSTPTAHCSKVSEVSPFSEMESEINDPSFNWESVSGRVFTDSDGEASSEWTTYTGSVKILKIHDWPTSSQRFSMSERQDLPPELMIGGKVLRQAVKPPRISGSKRPRGESDSPKEGNSPSGGGNANTTSTASAGSGLSLSAPAPGSLQELMDDLNPRDDTPIVAPSRSTGFSPMDRIKRIFDRSPLSSQDKDKLRSGSDNNSSSDEKSHHTDDDELVDQIGTVTAITSWPNDMPGTAREILWDDGERETVRWGAANGCFDVTHVAMKGNKVVTRYPHPLTYITKLASSGFGSEQTYGVIMRLRHIPKDASSPNDGVRCQVVAILEYGDFNANIYCDGVLYTDGTYSLTEQRLLSGPSHSGWESRFGTTHYQPGTTYSFSVSQSSSKDITDPTQNVLSGEYQFRANFPIKSYEMLGDLRLQRRHLFVFDEKVKANNINVSNDRLSCSKSSGGSQGVVFGSVGFSSGVHYWEVKVEQGDLGSIFIGVSEKPADIRGARLSRWMGAGFASNRAAFRTALPGGGGDRVAVYGDHFHTGDQVGVLLDLNRGKLSFVLDGLKYGEHSICDLGEAFDNMTAPTMQKPRTYFPVVGLSKNLDRVILTPRWLSNVGMSVADEYKLYNKAWLLLSSWSIERPMNKPFSEHMWIYREGWRNWLSWLSAKTIRIRTRCKASALVVNITPRACVIASLKLGLQTALFSGDRVIFTKTSGRALDIKEEAVILGVYNGMLWYRLDAQTQNGGALMESNTLAWCLVPNDVEGMSLLRRRPVENSRLPTAVTELVLPRLPAYHGGLLHLHHESGAVVRRGLEIDTSEVVCEIPGNSTVYAIERRTNASNIERYRVLYEGHYGWISEKMRGGAEEVMLNRVTTATAEEKRVALAKLTEQAEVAGITDRIVFQDVSSLKEGLTVWEQSVREAGAGELLSVGGALSSEPGEGAFRDKSFEYFLSLSSTIDGVKQWTVEADMQLVELISNCAAREGVTPHNLSAASLERAIASVKPSSKTNCLVGVDTARAVARSAILRVANLIFGNALPYINLMLPEEKLKNDVIGSDCDIQSLPTPVPACTVPKTDISGDSCPTKEVGPSPMTLTIGDSMKYKDYITFDEINKSRNPLGSWVPLCCARRMRSLRRLLFNQTKQQFFDAILEVTTTATPLHQDEYEDPREIKSLRINRVKATASKLAAITVPSERLKQSVFGQLHRELRQWPSSAYRRSYVGKGHGNQKRAFKVKFIGEGVNDYGGPYRAVFEQVIDELQCDTVLAGGRKASERCLLPLLVPCPNRFTGVGINQDKFVLNTAPSLQPINQELMNFFGKIVGTAVRHHLNLALDLSSLFWRPLVMLPVARGHLQTVDTLIVNNLNDVTKVGLRIEEEWKASGASFNGNYQPEEWVDMTFTSFLPDGSRVNLLAGGHDIPVNMSNWREYVTMTEQLRLRESVNMYKIFRDGLANVLPVEIFPLFTAGELQHLMSGSSEVDIQLIQQCTEYEDIDPNSALVANFWEVLQEMSSEEKTLFLRFVWARSRMPASAKDLPMNFKLQGQQAKSNNESSDDYLPHAQTCFFSLSLPAYSSKEILRTKLLYAINNSPNMDADVRLHSAEGWADS